jgi:hypothetical protein
MKFRIAGVLALALLLAWPAAAKDVSAWSETAADNDDAAPDGWTSGTMTPSQVEPTAREGMAALRRWYSHANAVKTSAGTANVQTLTYDVAPTAYVTGDCYTFKVGTGLTNTGSTTLNVNSLGAKTIKVAAATLTGGEIIAARVASVCYDGTDFQLGNSAVAGVAGPRGASGLITTATVTVEGYAKLHNVPLAVGWPATLNPNNIVLAALDQNSTITKIKGSIEVATGAAATVSVYKAPSGTACSAGTILHSGSVNANGTEATDQTLTLTVTTVAAGDRICLQTTGTTSWTTGTGIGTITVFLAPTP